MWVTRSEYCVRRTTMSTITMAVVVSISVACQLIVRHTCVCLARPSQPAGSRSMPFHQSQNPVSAVATETIAPATIT